MIGLFDDRRVGGGLVILHNNFGNSGKKQAESGIQAAGEQAYERAKQTPDEAGQYSRSFELGKLLEQVLKGQQGMGELPEGFMSGEQQLQSQGELSKTLYDQTLNEAKDPDAYFMSTLQPELQQAQDTINSYYQKRGLLNSGLAIEQMGRAGVDLAIKQAQARMGARQQALDNALQISQYGSNMGQTNFANLANIYSTQQNSGLNSLSRQANAANNAATYQAYPHQARLGDYYGKQAAINALPGQLIEAGGKAAGAAAAGCWVAAEIFGGWYAPKTVLARNYVNAMAPKWFFNFYIKNGEEIAKFIKNKPILKLALRPLFELFAKLGRA
jgi:hypothetical protein